MTLVMLGLDAADTRLVEEFSDGTLTLEASGRMESVAYRFDDRPHTGEVWPTVATGLHPSEHGVTGTGEWSNPVIDLGARILNKLSIDSGVRDNLADVAGNVGSWELTTVDGPTIFDGNDRTVHNWPGVHRNESLHYIWDIIENSVRADSDPMPHAVFEAQIKGEARSKFAWVWEMLHHDFALVATHVHVLDAFGHAYSDDRERMRGAYEWTGAHVARVLEEMGEDDELLILSDHGMETTWIDTDRPDGMHSWRAYSASTTDSRPRDVMDVREWVEGEVESVSMGHLQVDMPEEQLRQLGYIE